MFKRALLLLVVAAGCGLPEKTHCSTSSDCLSGDSCLAGTCQPTSDAACGPTRATCAAEATCADTGSGVACTCSAGYTGDGLSCADINECTATASPCAPHAGCSNQPASFSCACDAGFTGDGSGYCVPAHFTKVAAAGGFSCGLSADGGIYCWGDNPLGELGNGTTAPETRPTQVGTATDWIDVDAHTIEGCGIRSDHSMWCWGFGNTGQLGDGTTVTKLIPTEVISDKPGIGWKAMALGRQHACAIHDDGSLACWGLDRVTGESVTAPVAVDSNTDWTAISTGTVRCGLRGMPGLLYCWGKASGGDLGLGEITSQATPAQVGTDTWKAIAVGYNNTCGIRSDGALLCWGDNPSGRIALQYGSTPRQIGTATDWQAVSLASTSIIGLRAGTAYAWGVNSAGQLGMPEAAEVAEPTAIAGINNWTSISAGNVHGCGIADGQAYCWGTVSVGFLGNGVTTTLLSPAKIGGEHFTSITGNGVSQCGIRSGDSALLCRGDDAVNGVGFGDLAPRWTMTRLGTEAWSAVTGSSGVFDVSSSATCAIRGGLPYCWGDNTFGELGLGNTTGPQLSPAAVHVPGGTQWTEIAVASHSCAIASNEALSCWGANDVGSWLHVAVTSRGFMTGATCGIRTDHTLWCWGQDLGAVGTHVIPTQIGTSATWAALSLTSGPTICAVQTNGSLWCWGEPPIGDGTMTASATPVQIGSASDWKTVSAGAPICAIKRSGTLWCWGNGGPLGDGSQPTYGALGDVVPATSPTQIGSDTDWSTVDTHNAACGTKTDGALWCWGAGAAEIPNVVTTPTLIH
jgi:alpha-tubulin suppressor-like RCC1 family protein